MPLRNRVTPFGELVAVPERGMFMGNRGLLHNREREIVRFHQVRRWISCTLEFRGQRRPLMEPGMYTELFFLDEATALAAGHRPCFLCRRPEALRFRAAWAEATGNDSSIAADAFDRLLHDDRLASRGVMRRWPTDGTTLPDGATVAVGGEAFLVRGGALLGWSPGGYVEARPMPGVVEVLTPRAIVAAIGAGYAPVLHPTAG